MRIRSVKYRLSNPRGKFTHGTDFQGGEESRKRFSHMGTEYIKENQYPTATNDQESDTNYKKNNLERTQSSTIVKKSVAVSLYETSQPRSGIFGRTKINYQKPGQECQSIAFFDRSNQLVTQSFSNKFQNSKPSIFTKKMRQQKVEKQNITEAQPQSFAQNNSKVAQKKDDTKQEPIEDRSQQTKVNQQENPLQQTEQNLQTVEPVVQNPSSYKSSISQDTYIYQIASLTNQLQDFQKQKNKIQKITDQMKKGFGRFEQRQLSSLNEFQAKFKERLHQLESSLRKQQVKKCAMLTNWKEVIKAKDEKQVGFLNQLNELDQAVSNVVLELQCSEGKCSNSS